MIKIQFLVSKRIRLLLKLNESSAVNELFVQLATDKMKIINFL